MAADDLTIEGAKASAAIILTLFSQIHHSKSLWLIISIVYLSNSALSIINYSTQNIVLY